MYYSKRLSKFKKIKHCFFSRNNGFSKGIYKSLNCGRGSKDDKKNVIENLDFVSKKMSVLNNRLILMNQTHSAKVTLLNNKNLKKKINSDAVVTKLKNVALGVVTADCVPILIFDLRNNIIGCIHAGWKGAFSGIIKNTIFKIKKMSNSNLIYASIGPCIGKESYEVDLKFYKKFIKKSKNYKKYFLYKNKIKKNFDIRKFISDQLLQLNVKIDHVNHDTFKEKTNFFSYRRSCKLKQNDYGRCISVIRLI